jgi:DNA modification methylase
MTNAEPYYKDDTVTLYHGDSIEVLRMLPDASIDSVVTDPRTGSDSWAASGMPYPRASRGHGNAYVC